MKKPTIKLIPLIVLCSSLISCETNRDKSSVGLNIKSITRKGFTGAIQFGDTTYSDLNQIWIDYFDENFNMYKTLFIKVNSQNKYDSTWISSEDKFTTVGNITYAISQGDTTEVINRKGNTKFSYNFDNPAKPTLIEQYDNNWNLINKLSLGESSFSYFKFIPKKINEGLFIESLMHGYLFVDNYELADFELTNPDFNKISTDDNHVFVLYKYEYEFY